MRAKSFKRQILVSCIKINIRIVIILEAEIFFMFINAIQQFSEANTEI